MSALQDDGLAEQMQQAAERAQKWKERCGKLRQDLMETQTAAASLEAALSVRQLSSQLTCFPALHLSSSLSAEPLSRNCFSYKCPG